MDAATPVGTDRRTRWSLGVLHFLVITAFTWARIARDGALLSRVAVEWVPWLTVLILVVTALASPVVAWLARQDPFRALARLAVTTGLSLVAWEWLLRQPGTWSVITLYVWVGAYGPLLVAQFWVLVQAHLDPQQARRHIGWIGAAGIAGGIAAGLIASVLSRRSGLDEILGLSVLAHLVVGTLALGRRQATMTLPESPAALPLRAGTILREASYARLVAVVAVLGAVTGGLVDYQFKLSLQQQSTDPSALGAWLGLFNVAVGGVALLAQLVTGALLARSGSHLLAFVLPSGVIAGAVAGMAWPAVPWPAVGTRLWENAARHSLARTAQEFFFLPFQGGSRVVMKHAVEGYLTRGGEVLASLVLVLMAMVGRADTWHLSLAMGLVATAWVLHLGWLTRGYGPALSRSLDALLRPGRADAPLDVDRGVAVPELVTMLRSPDARHVVFALDELVAIDPDRARALARGLVAHAAHEVRVRARQVLMPVRRRAVGTRMPWTGADAGLAAVLASGDVARASTACAAVVAASDRLAVPVLLAHLSGPIRVIVRDSLVGLGDASVGTLGDALADTRVALRVRRDVALVLARIGTPAALAQLTRVTDAGPRALRGLALRGLDAARKRGVPVLLDPDQERDALGRDLAEMDRRRQQAAVMRGEPAAGVSLLARALEEAALQARERVFRRLALVYPAREMLRAHRGIASGDPRIAAFAIEYLEATLLPEHRDPVLAALRAGDPEVTETADHLLRELARDDDPWIGALAAHVIGARADRSFRSVLEGVVARDGVHAETLAWAMERV